MMYGNQPPVLYGNSKMMEDDLYKGFDEIPAALDTRTLLHDEAFQEAVRQTAIGRRPTHTAMRLNTGISRMATGARTAMATAGRANTAARPMTAMKAAGFNSSQEKTAAPPLLQTKEQSADDKIKQLEAKIVHLIEESSSLRVPNDPDDPITQKNKSYDPSKSLSKAQEAANLERQLLKMQEQAGISDASLEITFMVSFNLSCAYWSAGFVSEALQAQAICARTSSNGGVGAVPPHVAAAHLVHSDHRKALKLYRMALDSTPAGDKNLKLKIMHNIGILLVRMGKFRDAVTTFQHMMHEGPDFITGLHLVLCQVSLGEIAGARAAFVALAAIDINLDDDIIEEDGEEPQNDASINVLNDVLRSDKLSEWLKRKRAIAVRSVIRAAHAISLADPTGMEWCAETLRGSASASLAGALEAAGALIALRSGKSQAAKTALRRLAALPRLKALANTDLAFISFMEGDIGAAVKLTEDAGSSSGAALVTRALCECENQDPPRWRTARDLLRAAAIVPPSSETTVRDIHYYLGLVSEKMGLREEAIVNFDKAARSAPGDVSSKLRLAALARAYGDVDGASHWYHQVLGDVPDDCGVYIELAKVYEDGDDLSMAHHCYLDADAIFPGRLDVISWLGNYARNKGDVQAAMRYFKRAEILCPNQIEWGLQQGATLRAGGQYKEALKLYRRLNRKFPDNIHCLQMLLKLCTDQGLKEAEQWAAELQRARRPPATGESPLTVGSGGSSRGSFSPPENGGPTSLNSKSRRSNSSRNNVPINSASSQQSSDQGATARGSANSLRRLSGRGERNIRTKSEDLVDLPLPPE